MKKTRLISICLMTVFCLIFISCSNDDDPQINPDIKKRLVSINYDGYSNEKKTFSSSEFEYKNNKVVKFVASHHVAGNPSYNRVESIVYSYSGNTIKAVSDNFDTHGKWSNTANYTLNSNGLVSKGEIKNDLWTYSYTNGRLTSAVRLNTHNNLIDIDNKYTYNSEGNMTSNNSFTAIKYTEIPNVGNLFLAYYDSFAPTIIDLLGATDLAGKPSKYLPKEAYDMDGERFSYSYDLDKDGYVSKVTEKTAYSEKTATYVYKVIE